METTITSIDDYRVLALVGDGGQANVYLCRKEERLYAIKVFNSGLSHGEAFNRETRFLSLLQEHYNLIKMHKANVKAIIKNVDGTQLTKSIIVLEYAEKGDLFEYISITKAFRAEFCRAIFKGLLNGIEHLNDLGITHRDMKPENVLFNDDFQLKISDFGLSALSEGAEKDFILTTKVGTEGFKAPEVDSGQYNGHKADIFALGVILFMLYAGSPPFLSTSRLDKIYKHIMSKNFEKFWSIHEKNRAKGYFPPGLKSLLNSMLSSNPEQRPSVDQIKENQWLNLETASNQSLQSQLHSRFEKIILESKNKEKIRAILEKNLKKNVKKEKAASEPETTIEQAKLVEQLFETAVKEELKLKSESV